MTFAELHGINPTAWEIAPEGYHDEPNQVGPEREPLLALAWEAFQLIPQSSDTRAARVRLIKELTRWDNQKDAEVATRIAEKIADMTDDTAARHMREEFVAQVAGIVTAELAKGIDR
jgi:hypothetical protein